MWEHVCAQQGVDSPPWVSVSWVNWRSAAAFWQPLRWLGSPPHPAHSTGSSMSAPPCLQSYTGCSEYREREQDAITSVLQMHQSSHNRTGMLWNGCSPACLLTIKPTVDHENNSSGGPRDTIPTRNISSNRFSAKQYFKLNQSTECLCLLKQWSNQHSSAC